MAKIKDGEWLAAFQGRKTDVRPGDALRCKARTEMAYGFDNELITERYDGHAYAGSFFSLAKRPSLIRGFRTGGFLVLFEEEHNFLKIKKSVGQSCLTVNLPHIQ